MYLKFVSIYIEGFQSIEKANINLSENGIVLVKGINNYEDNASSNGSGKSSIFEALNFAVYGRTSQGISDPTNRYTPNGCIVKLIFFLDDQEYTIIRSIKHKIHKTGIKVFKGSEDISARNKTDTEKMIRSDIIPISQEIFLSTVFLSQGFSSRLSILPPSGRKERIEILTDTAQQVDIFRDKIMNIKDNYSEKYDKVQREISYQQGTADNIQRQIDSLISEIENEEKDKPEGNPEDVSLKISKFEELLKNVRGMKDNLLEDISKLKSDLNSYTYKCKSYEKQIATEESNKNDLLSGKPCPTCGHKTISEVSQEVIRSISDKICSLKESLLSEKENESICYNKLSDLEKQRDILSNKESSINSNINTLQFLLRELSKFRDTSKDREKVEELKSNLNNINSEIISMKDKESVYKVKKDVAHHCSSLISKQFRGYLLQGIIDFMNNRLLDYSRMLFSNEDDVINLVIDSSKLDIYLKDALYDTLSGGERRKVDLALVLTQRDLALNIAGFSCNILILDETLENMDELATISTLDLLNNIASQVDSMYIISHNNYAIPYDSVITVTKNKNRISSVSIDVL